MAIDDNILTVPDPIIAVNPTSCCFMQLLLVFQEMKGRNLIFKKASPSSLSDLSLTISLHLSGQRKTLQPIPSHKTNTQFS